MICRACKKDKSLNEFYVYQTKWVDKKCKECKKIYQKKYQVKNLEKVRKASRDWHDMKRIGRPREEILDKICAICGGNERLSIHHKDNNGRMVSNPNNALGNLITLCNRCHTRLHARKAKRYNKNLQAEVVKVWNESNRVIGKKLNIAHGTVRHLREEVIKLIGDVLYVKPGYRKQVVFKGKKFSIIPPDKLTRYRRTYYERRKNGGSNGKDSKRRKE